MLYTKSCFQINKILSNLLRQSLSNQRKRALSENSGRTIIAGPDHIHKYTSILENTFVPSLQKASRVSRPKISKPQHLLVNFVVERVTIKNRIDKSINKFVINIPTVALNDKLQLTLWGMQTLSLELKLL